MSFFGNVAKTEAPIEESKDTLGGGGFGPLETDAYKFKITMAYCDESKGGAKNVNLTLKTPEGRVIRPTVYVTSGTSKGCKHTYER